MSKNFKETMHNGETYYAISNHKYTARMMDSEGFTARIDTLNRTYSVITRIDESAEMVIMEISPSIHCPKEARSQVGEYIDKINAIYKCCNLRMAPNGNIHIHTEQRFNDAPLSVLMFKIMEGECIKILDAFYIPLEKLAHIKLLEPDEADVEKVIKKHIEKVTKQLAEDLPDNFPFGEDESEDEHEDEDDFRHISIPEPPGFSEWIRKRAERRDAIAASLFSKKEEDSSEESSDVVPGSLFDQLLSISDEEGESDIS